MKKVLMISAIVLVIAAIGLPTRGQTAPSPAVQETIIGDWTAKVRQTDRGPVLWLSLNSNSGAGKERFKISSDVPLQDFTGLNPNADPNTQFTLEREAGVVLFDGLFEDGRGVGYFRFTPNIEFISTMRNLGYGDLSAEMLGYGNLSVERRRDLWVAKLFLMTMYDIGLKFINELKSLGYNKIPSNKLIAMRIYGADGDFIRRMQTVGYRDVPEDGLIAMRRHDVDEKFIREVEAMGYKDLPVDKLIEIRIHGVDAKFAKEMKDQGFRDLSIDDLIKLRIHGVDSDYGRRVKGNR